MITFKLEKIEIKGIEFYQIIHPAFYRDINKVSDEFIDVEEEVYGELQFFGFKRYAVPRGFMTEYRIYYFEGNPFRGSDIAECVSAFNSKSNVKSVYNITLN